MDEETEPRLRADGARPRDRRSDVVWWATCTGLVVVLVGLVNGVATALARKAVDCPDGTIFSAGDTDHTCYVHPDAGLGIGIAALSMALGALIVIVSIAAKAVLQTRPRV